MVLDRETTLSLKITLGKSQWCFAKSEQSFHDFCKVFPPAEIKIRSTREVRWEHLRDGEIKVITDGSYITHRR